MKEQAGHHPHAATSRTHKPVGPLPPTHQPTGLPGCRSTRLVQTLWKKIWKLLKNLNIDLPYDPAIPLLRIYPKECDTGYSRGTGTPMFIEALFTIAKLWKQPRCPTTDEWIKKMWCLYTMEFYSAMKINEILSLISKGMELESIILSEVSQAQKTKNHTFSLICGL
jgi:hypothetical protein